MKKLSVALLMISVALLLAGLPAFAQSSSKSDMQSAGQESKSAAQDAGRATEKTADKAKDKLTGKIDINSASSEDLQKLPGVDAATADKIIAGRPYTSKGDLLSRGIVSHKEYDAIRDNIVAHKAMLLAFGEGRQEVLQSHVRAASNDTPATRQTRWWWLAFAMLAIASASGAGWMMLK